MTEEKQCVRMDPYSEKSFVVRGDTKPIKEQLTKLHGKWNTNLKGGEGWIFSNKRLDQVQSFLGSKSDRILAKDSEVPSEFATMVFTWPRDLHSTPTRSSSLLGKRVRELEESLDQLNYQIENLSRTPPERGCLHATCSTVFTLITTSILLVGVYTLTQPSSTIMLRSMLA